MDAYETLKGWINRLFGDVEPYRGWLILGVFMVMLSKAFRLHITVK